MTLHDSTFGFLAPTSAQKQQMDHARVCAKRYADELESLLPDGADKTYVLRKLREVAMWANVALTREPNGAPRD